MSIGPVKLSGASVGVPKTDQLCPTLGSRIRQVVSNFFHWIFETGASMMRAIRGRQITQNPSSQQYELPSGRLDALVPTCHDVPIFVKDFSIWYAVQCGPYASTNNEVTKTRVINEEIPQWFKGKTLTKEREKAILLMLLLKVTEQFFHLDFFKAIVAQCTHIREFSDLDRGELLNAVGHGILLSPEDPTLTDEGRKIVIDSQGKDQVLMTAFGM